MTICSDVQRPPLLLALMVNMREWGYKKSHTEKNINIQPLIEVNLPSSKSLIKKLLLLTRTRVPTIIGTPRNSHEQNVTEALFPFIFYFLTLIRVFRNKESIAFCFTGA